MNKLSDSIRDHAFNPDKIAVKVKKPRRRSPWLPIGVAAALVVTIVALALSSGIFAPSQPAYAMVSIDINPSFEIYTDADGRVVEIKTVNEDAADLKLSGLIGKPIDKAVAIIIERAIEAGFLDEGDQLDYVLVSTAMLTDDPDADEKQDSLGQQIANGLLDGIDPDSDVRVAIIKATKRELFEARGKKIPLGLYIINGMVETEGGVMVPVSEFVADKENLKKLENRARIIEKKANHENNGNGKGNGNGNGNGNKG